MAHYKFHSMALQGCVMNEYCGVYVTGGLGLVGVGVADSSVVEDTLQS